MGSYNASLHVAVPYITSGVCSGKSSDSDLQVLYSESIISTIEKKLFKQQSKSWVAGGLVVDVFARDHVFIHFS